MPPTIKSLLIYGTIVAAPLDEFIPLFTDKLRRKLTTQMDPDEIYSYLYDIVSSPYELKLEGTKYFLYQPNNERNSKIYLIQQMYVTEPYSDEEYTIVKQPTRESIVKFNKYLADNGIYGELKQYLVQMYR